MRNPTRLATMLACTCAVVLGTAAPTAPVGAAGARTPMPSPILSPPLDEITRGKSAACSGTSRAAQRACAADADDEYWTSVGKCLNIADAGLRQQCLDEAKVALDEAQALCSEQYAAREQVCVQIGQDPYDPAIVAANFLSPTQAALNPHPYFPLVPGTTWRYAGGGETNDVTVTGETKEIQNVQCFVVRDVVRVGGVVTEDTQDWLAVDIDGNVWYLGEHSETWEDGELVALDGSWKTAVNGARPGIIMKAQPQVANVYRQEYLVGEAEDMGEVISVTGTESAPAASCSGDCVVTHDFTPIDPGSVEEKYYANGVGLILEVDTETGARTELTELHVPVFAAGAGARGRSVSDALLSQLRVAGLAGSRGSAVRFDLDRGADVNVDIYDPAGRRVFSLFTGRRERGHHEFTWPATDESGRRVASGVYFVRVRAGAESATERIAVLAR